jgi:hypothetical protein
MATTLDPRIRIPKALYRGFEVLLKLPEKLVTELVEAIRKTSPKLAYRDYIAGVAEKIDIPIDDLEQVVGVLISLAGLRMDLGSPVPEFIDGISAVLQKIPSLNLAPKNENWDFDLYMISLLELDHSLGVMAGVARVQSNYERLYQDGSVLVDLRPVFTRAPDQVPAAVIAVYQLRVAYYVGGETKEMHFSMSPQDIRDLAKNLDLALQETEGLKSLLAATVVPILD